MCTESGVRFFCNFSVTCLVSSRLSNPRIVSFLVLWLNQELGRFFLLVFFLDSFFFLSHIFEESLRIVKASFFKSRHCVSLDVLDCRDEGRTGCAACFKKALVRFLGKLNILWCLRRGEKPTCLVRVSSACGVACVNLRSHSCMLGDNQKKKQPAHFFSIAYWLQNAALTQLVEITGCS